MSLSLFTRFNIFSKLLHENLRGLTCISVNSRFSSTQSSEPEICVTSDRSCIVCYHPSDSFPYEHSKPIRRPDPSKPEESIDGPLKMKYKYAKYNHHKQGPGPEELAQMFYTTKHRWYPIGLWRRSKINRNMPRERPYL